MARTWEPTCPRGCPWSPRGLATQEVRAQQRLSHLGTPARVRARLAGARVIERGEPLEGGAAGAGRRDMTPRTIEPGASEGPGAMQVLPAVLGQHGEFERVVSRPKPPDRCDIALGVVEEVLEISRAAHSGAGQGVGLRVHRAGSSIKFPLMWKWLRA